MKDIDIRNIQPVVERRTPEKPGSVEKPVGDAFQKVLDAKITAAKPAGGIEQKVSEVDQKVAQTAEQIREMQSNLKRMLVEMQMRKDKSDS